MVLLEYLKEQDIQLKINIITLIEPSEIALKRASLHVAENLCRTAGNEPRNPAGSVPHPENHLRQDTETH